MYKNERLELRLTAAEVETLDRVRGSATRSAWLRNQIALAGPPARSAAGDALASVTGVAQPPVWVEPPTEPTKRHLHKFIKGDQTGFRQGQKIHNYACACGTTKEDY